MSVAVEMWESFRRLPLWVQVWMTLLLVPVNVATLAFLGGSNGVLLAVLAIAGMAFNMPIMVSQGGMSKLMALPHLIFWIPLLVVALITLFGDAGSGQRVFLVVLIVIDAVSLAFDVRDFAHWRNGDRAAV